MIKTCIICGKEFDAPRPDKQVCSKECHKERDRRYAKKSQQVRAPKADQFNDWLTIPDVPNYEINSALQVRRKSDGKILSTHTPQYPKKSPICSLRKNKKSINRSPKTLRGQAEAAATNDEWYPVPSLANLYEFNNKNQLRNVKTKKMLPLHAGSFRPRINKKAFNLSIVTLRWEIFGELPPYGSSIKKAVIIGKGKTTLYFDSRASAARFIAQSEFYSFSAVNHLMVNRQPEICGWHINYLEDEITKIDPYLKGMQKNDPRPK